jgi:hypothetical protein
MDVSPSRQQDLDFASPLAPVPEACVLTASLQLEPPHSWEMVQSLTAFAIGGCHNSRSKTEPACSLLAPCTQEIAPPLAPRCALFPLPPASPSIACGAPSAPRVSMQTAMPLAGIEPDTFRSSTLLLILYAGGLRAAPPPTVMLICLRLSFVAAQLLPSAPVGMPARRGQAGQNGMRQRHPKGLCAPALPRREHDPASDCY